MTKTTLSYLVESPFETDFKVYHISARMVSIWPETFSLGVTAYCNTCDIDFDTDQLEHHPEGYISCKGCQKSLPLKLRFVILLCDGDMYLPALLSQERALKFFGLSCNLNELKPSMCKNIDIKYHKFFSSNSSSIDV
ncbi:hypothetical protein MXB_1357, partial [Myxobolus squamalis]